MALDLVTPVTTTMPIILIQLMTVVITMTSFNIGTFVFAITTPNPVAVDSYHYLQYQASLAQVMITKDSNRHLLRIRSSLLTGSEIVRRAALSETP